MSEFWFYILWISSAYLWGSISAGDFVARLSNVNIRELGTGNPGTANIYREMGPKYGITVFLLDITKGATVTVPLFFLEVPGWVVISAVLTLLAGQIFPVFYRFRGNTGMAACMGTTAGLLPFGALVGIPITFVAIRLTRNTGWCGLLFFAITILAGSLLHRDFVAALAILLGGSVVFVRSLIQYNIIRSIRRIVENRINSRNQST